jgi:diguanylate cyclase (GGDEF)-like protein
MRLYPVSIAAHNEGQPSQPTQGIVELLRSNLAIEPDLQNFIQFVLSAVSSLGGNVFAASLATLDMTRALRAAGAASGYPLPASLKLDQRTLLVAWGDNGQQQIASFSGIPDPAAVERLRRHLQQSTAAADPALLLRRNAEMERFLNETRERTEKEIEAMQVALGKRQEQLSASIHQAETDALTGLLNRRAYDAKLSQAFNRTRRQKTEALSLLLFDLDFFKQVNDEFGHQFGDAYLNKMAHAMRAAIRDEVDLAFRFGGDEFAIVQFCDEAIACRTAMEVLAAMDGKVSIGVATLKHSQAGDFDLPGFIKQADDALYEAKRAGRGRVVVSGCSAPGGGGCTFFCPKLNETPCPTS